mmetsp:Transcript_1302/g.5550  ORF Transcript_1302/g.5550 Transcript_1302/m.5550 type:complete len:303 (+) Transcript_1302:488-1396(+)
MGGLLLDRVEVEVAQNEAVLDDLLGGPLRQAGRAQACEGAVEVELARLGPFGASALDEDGVVRPGAILAFRQAALAVPQRDEVVDVLRVGEAQLDGHVLHLGVDAELAKVVHQRGGRLHQRAVGEGEDVQPVVAGGEDLDALQLVADVAGEVCQEALEGLRRVGDVSGLDEAELGDAVAEVGGAPGLGDAEVRGVGPLGNALHVGQAALHAGLAEVGRRHVASEPAHDALGGVLVVLKQVLLHGRGGDAVQPSCILGHPGRPAEAAESLGHGLHGVVGKYSTHCFAALLLCCFCRSGRCGGR